MQWHLINAEVVNSEEFGGIDSSIDVDLCIKVNSIKAIKHHKTFLPKIIAFDIESDEFEIGKGEILMISLYGEKTKKVFLLMVQMFLIFKICFGVKMEIIYFLPLV